MIPASVQILKAIRSIRFPLNPYNVIDLNFIEFFGLQKDKTKTPPNKNPDFSLTFGVQASARCLIRMPDFRMEPSTSSAALTGDRRTKRPTILFRVSPIGSETSSDDSPPQVTYSHHQ
jgi:hypothetical protein